MNKLEKVFCIFLITITIFMIGIQFGILQGRKLEYEERNWEYCNGY